MDLHASRRATWFEAAWFEVTWLEVTSFQATWLDAETKAKL
jgi:nicotinic acid phosphoribosyltransferase